MELALYCPNTGFYEQEADNIGRRGDYFTSVSVGSLFSELLAFQFAEWLENELNIKNEKLKIVEAGAHDGKLARDILNWLMEFRPRDFEKVEYWLVEPSVRRRAWQMKNLAGFEHHVHLASSLEELESKAGGVRGIIFSNEFLDALPVHRFGWDSQKREWFEWGIGVSDKKFVWAQMPKTFMPDFGLTEAESVQLAGVLPDGFTVEVCPAAAKWWREAAGILDSGKLLTIDYGLAAEELFLPQRREGTVRAYHKHHLNPDVLANPGEQDITAHVNFTALRTAGEREGLATDNFTAQEKFLANIARTISENPSAFGGWTAARARQFQTLTHPEHLGRKFSVLVQSRRGGG